MAQIGVSGTHPGLDGPLLDPVQASKEVWGCKKVTLEIFYPIVAGWLSIYDAKRCNLTIIFVGTHVSLFSNDSVKIIIAAIH